MYACPKRSSRSCEIDDATGHLKLAANLGFPLNRYHFTSPAQTILFFSGPLPNVESAIVTPNGPIGVTWFNPKTSPPTGAPFPSTLPPAPTSTGTSNNLSPGVLQHLKQSGADFFDASLGLIIGDDAL